MRERLEQYSHGGLTLSGAEVSHFVNILYDFQSQANQFELLAIPLSQKLNLDDLDGNVVMFPAATRTVNFSDGVAS